MRHDDNVAYYKCQMLFHLSSFMYCICSIMNIAACCFPSMPVLDTLANTCDHVHSANSHAFFQLFRNWHKRHTKHPFSTWVKTSTETPQCLGHTHARPLQPSEQSSSQSCWTSLIRCQTPQLFTQTLQRRSQHWCKDTKSCLNRMQDITCIITF